jgi:3-hydroxybutyryl-CoA dehydrogenase
MPQPPDSPTTVAIIGAGPLGRRLAARAASCGFRVMLEDVLPGTLHHAREYIRQQLSPEALRGAGGAGVVFVSTIEDAVREADLAIDCVPDELESKLEILWLIDRMAPPRTVIATPTTELSIADLAACTYRPEKCVAIAAGPRELIDLDWLSGGRIELRAGPATAAESLELVREFWRRLDMRAEIMGQTAGSADRP